MISTMMQKTLETNVSYVVNSEETTNCGFVVPLAGFGHIQSALGGKLPVIPIIYISPTLGNLLELVLLEAKHLVVGKIATIGPIAKCFTLFSFWDR
ncbi:unnamed protein product [Leptosia nina]|uniref:Uncharacterized protein n=1 Tax=Leptosia nina TaxID=320188 RepID=A0AAV1JH06_9NEOP